jgi:spermidine synthase
MSILAGGVRYALLPRAAADAKEVFESPYNYIIVSTVDRVVTFRRMENGVSVSAIDLDNPRPAKALNIGLGAGAFNRLFGITFPEARMTTVEIDPMIVDVARRLTGFADGPNNQVVIADGRRYLRQSADTWDWIIVDAYVRNSQVPPHLTTLEFFDLAKSRLADNGVLAMNLHRGTKVFASVIATLSKAFPFSTPLTRLSGRIRLSQ